MHSLCISFKIWISFILKSINEIFTNVIDVCIIILSFIKVKWLYSYFKRTLHVHCRYIILSNFSPFRCYYLSLKYIFYPMIHTVFFNSNDIYYKTFTQLQAAKHTSQKGYLKMNPGHLITFNSRLCMLLYNRYVTYCLILLVYQCK